MLLFKSALVTLDQVISKGFCRGCFGEQTPQPQNYDSQDLGVLPLCILRHLHFKDRGWKSRGKVLEKTAKGNFF